MFPYRLNNTAVAGTMSHDPVPIVMYKVKIFFLTIVMSKVIRVFEIGIIIILC